MENLNAAELADALACLAQLYGHCDDKEFPRRALRALRELVPCEMAAFELRLDTGDKRAVGVSEPFEVHDDPHFAAFEKHMLDDPLVAMAHETGRIPIVAVSDLVSRRDYEGTGVYDEYFRHYGVRDRLAFSLGGGGPVMMGVALNRTRRGFSDRDRRVLAVVKPHLIQAWHSAQAVGRLRRELGERGIVTPAPQPLEPRELAGDMRGAWARAAGLTPREAAVLAQVALGLTNKQVGRELGISSRTVTKHLENAFPKLGVTTRGAAVALYVGCMAHRGPAADPEARSHRATSRRPAARAADASAGLTPREIEVLREVRAGKTDRQIAAALCIGPATVKKHLGHIFAKLGVATRAAAIARAHGVLRCVLWLCTLWSLVPDV